MNTIAIDIALGIIIESSFDAAVVNFLGSFSFTSYTLHSSNNWKGYD